ncbi:dTDP-4-dehydrorhamnose 3,5-epimerase family protein [Carboxydothermus hydrogenoformans]|uniref:dTDP-4-dehydrorhamnose 3,5-epimerase n=1 Tax=Carboxydothermus hydrogenoformans (strain ATCC BAA-161 / DSM 6008 / Z-2901) TaxID=246194 RepID=Q3ADG0_CARHZ|nr:dTDP-4-dehydrorhamnose 3,5-epimerase family protein [Carboxydothermus hydrogenoformans]ABB14514.1 dTDP-4-dehydrorhamnose 3,5-epimerase [Carboxydothermus hydrogenoformans Z-2901]
MEFQKGEIEGVIIRPLKKHIDERGWLCELFRQDEIEETIMPVMSYISQTLPGIVRGPHEHKEQTDYFAFIGPGNFKIYLWDNRRDSSTYGNRQIIYAGEDNPAVIIVPPGVVHAYKNVSTKPGLVFNSPNKLYAGWGRKEQVDEVRWENKENSPFIID